MSIEEKEQEDAQHYYKWEYAVEECMKTSFFLLLISTVEKELKRICTDVKDESNSSIDIEVGDMKRGICDASRKYLKTFGNFKKPNINDWKDLEALYKIRNRLIHGNLYIDEGASKADKKAFGRLLLKDVGLEKDLPVSFGTRKNNRNGYSIKITKEFCSYAVDMADKFIKTLNQEKHRVFYSPIQSIKKV